MSSPVAAKAKLGAEQSIKQFRVVKQQNLNSLDALISELDELDNSKMAVAQEVKEGGAPVIEVDGPQSPVTGAQAAAKGSASIANR